jgi:hypothetical protein
MASPELFAWPGGKKFAFSVIDDTDLATIENVRPVYQLLADLGLRTTKSVWVIAGTGQSRLGGQTCENPSYRDWLLHLQREGFEIGLHNVTYHTSQRSETIRGIDLFREIFGHDPKTLTNHVGTDESIYWYGARLSGWHALLYSVLTMFRYVGHSRGQVEGDPLFWGDVCKDRIKYVRNFVFGGMNTLKACPCMPYHDPARPFVNYWFASSPGGDCRRFNETLSEKEQDRLEAEGGACIMYTHFAKDFVKNGRLNSRFQQLMRRLAEKNGFFVPVDELLDYLLQQRGHQEITSRQRAKMERRWLLRKIAVGGE